MNGKVIVLHAGDNVATAVCDLVPGDVLQTGMTTLQVVEAVPFGYKVALMGIPRGAAVIKYGESIGLAMCDIPSGACVHIQNVESQRGRGDLPATRS